MELREITNQKDLLKQIHKSYQKDFPYVERMNWYLIRRKLKKGIITIIALIEESKLLGYAIVTKADGYVLLMYLAILKQERQKGYGSILLQQIQQYYAHEKAVVIEIERIGNGKNEIENQIRIKRKEFYQRNNFQEIDLFVNLCVTHYEILVQKLQEIPNEMLKEEIPKIELEVYSNMYGKMWANRNVKIVE